jgi:hypothetical protein
MPKDKEWSIVDPPPEGHKDVANWAWNLFEIAREERDRLLLPERWLANYQLYRGDHWKKGATTAKEDKQKVTINLFFANVERTKANITARNPVAEVIDLDGNDKESADTLTARLKKWWMDTNQKGKLGTTVQKMEKYGITIEHPTFNQRKMHPEITIIDPYSFFPAPGNWEDISDDPPYICIAYPEFVAAVEKKHSVAGIEPDDTYSVLGEDREDKKPVPSTVNRGTVSYSGTTNDIEQLGKPGTGDIKQAKCLVVEIWLRDETEITIKEPALDDDGNPVFATDEETGEEIPVILKKKQLKYPGGIRVIVLTGTGKKHEGDAINTPIVLEDMPNPSINLELPREVAQKSYLYDHFPFYIANSYEDTTNIWGFSAAEQVGDLNHKIDEIFSRMAAWINRIMFPPLIIPQNSGITKEMINNKPNLVLMPTNPQAAQMIGFVQIPNLPANFFQILDLFLNFFDRVYQIEDADRGIGPKGVTAASAIVALQERNAVLIQHKIEMVDYLVEQRGKCAISLFQNFGVTLETINVEEEIRPFLGNNFAGRNFNYVVESGSTVPKTSLQVAAQAERFYELGAVDRQALLENTGFPGWKKIIERVGEGQLDQALQILIAAGLEEEVAMNLKQYLLEPQGGPGNSPQDSKGSQPTKTKAGKSSGEQSKKPPLSVVKGDED